MIQFLFAAIHLGPYLSIQPSEKELGPENVGYILGGIAQLNRAGLSLKHWGLAGVKIERGGLDQFLIANEVQTIIRSSTEAVDGPNVEAMTFAAAQRLRIPTFVVEDFPSNY